MAEIELTKADFGPKRRALDKAVKVMVVFFVGWMASTIFYDVPSIPGMKDSAQAWVKATNDRFSGICGAVYGPEKSPDRTNREAR